MVTCYIPWRCLKFLSQPLLLLKESSPRCSMLWYFCACCCILGPDMGVPSALACVNHVRTALSNSVSLAVRRRFLFWTGLSISDSDEQSQASSFSHPCSSLRNAKFFSHCQSWFSTLYLVFDVDFFFDAELLSLTCIYRHIRVWHYKGRLDRSQWGCFAVLQVI